LIESNTIQWIDQSKETDIHQNDKKTDKRQILMNLFRRNMQSFSFRKRKTRQSEDNRERERETWATLRALFLALALRVLFMAHCFQTRPPVVFFTISAILVAAKAISLSLSLSVSLSLARSVESQGK
jgi:hypothetical protein